MAVQKLHEVCKATFPLSPIASAESVNRVRSIINTIKFSDLGLNPDDAAREQEHGFGLFGLNGRRGRHSVSARWAPPISYLHLYECDEFSMGVFCLPTSACIPLHNHPGMTVFSKLLYGSMHTKAYDWADPKVVMRNGNSRIQMAKLVNDEVLTSPCDPAVLHPTSGGNIHAFTAVTPCAVLDVLAPPYSTGTDRNCTYYREHPVSGLPVSVGGVEAGNHGLEAGQTYSWLEEYQPPDDFVVNRGVYRGPKIVL